MAGIGQLQTRVKFEKNVPTTSDSGRTIDSYQEFLTVWGELKRLSGSKTLEAYQAGLKGVWSLRVLWQSALMNELNLSVKVRVIANNRCLTIERTDVEDQLSHKWIVFLLKDSNTL